MKLRLVAVAALMCAAVALLPTAASAAPHSVGIQGFAFKNGTCPAPTGSNVLTVAANDTVTWQNCDGTTHTVTADDGTFNQSLTPGASTPAIPITHDVSYHCNIHSSMTGQIFVTGSTTTTTTKPTTTTAKPTTTTAKATTTSSSTSTSTTQTTLDLTGVFDGSTTSSSSSTTSTSTTVPDTKDEDGGSNAVAVVLLLIAIAGVGGGAFYAFRRMRPQA